MQFQIPEYKIDEGVWFLDSQDNVVYGIISMFTLAVTKEGTNVYYGVQLNDNTHYTIRESDVIPHCRSLKKPRFEPGDGVAYKIYLANNTEEIVYGKIAEVEITIYDMFTSEVVYTMEDDSDYWVLEDDVIGFADPKYVRDVEPEAQGAPV